jgi:hypothetical protein
VSGERRLPSATLRFYAELNDFLVPERRHQEQQHAFVGRPTVKDAIEALGVPHVEVDLILVNGRSVGFDHPLHDGDRVSVYPVFESLDIAPLVRLQDRPLRDPRFLGDVHLRKLVRWIRLLGFDAAYLEDADDARLARIAADEGRILLTRDRELLKRRKVTRGYWLRSTDPIEQAIEVVRRFQLTDLAAPFSRCPTCNGVLLPVDKQEVQDRIPPRTAAWLDRYRRCDRCGQLYWEGTHVPRLEETIRTILGAASREEP